MKLKYSRGLVSWLGLLLAVQIGLASSCNNILQGKQVRATGDWSPIPWNAVDPYGLLEFDSGKCVYSLTVGGLKPSTKYSWKVCTVL